MDDIVKRRPPTQDEKLAAALLNMMVVRDGRIEPAFTAEEREQLKGATAAQIASLFQFDHLKLHGLADTQEEAEALMHPTNLTPRFIVAHRKKSPHDSRAIRKTKRIAEAHVAHHTAVAARDLTRGTETTPSDRPRKLLGKQKIRSRGFVGSRKFNGDVTWKRRAKTD